MDGAPITVQTPVPTHGGGLVYRWQGNAVRYLLVTAKDDEQVWVWPKGHIESGDAGDTGATARREVEEEARVSAMVVAPLALSSFTRRDENIVVAYHLMRYVAPIDSRERRKVRWATYAEAMQLLTHEDARAVLVEAQPVLVDHLAAASESGFAAQFLMKEYDALTQEVERNEGRGETRLSMFMTLVTAVIAGLVTLAASDHASAANLVRPVVCFSLVGMLAIGVVLFFRLLKRNEATDGMVADLKSLRAIVRERLDPTGLLGTWRPFKRQLWSGRGGAAATEPRRKFGGLADTVAVINSILAGALAMVLAAEAFPADSSSRVAAWGFVAALATLATHLVYENVRWERHERDVRAGTRLRMSKLLTTDPGREKKDAANEL